MFTVVHANHIEDLRDLALAMIEREPLAPLESETFLVQSNGMGQWLQMSIASRQGVAASIEFPLPASFVWRAYRVVLGQGIPQQSPFDRPALVWRLMALLPECLGDPDFAPLADYLERERDESGLPAARHCHQLAERLSALFDQYLVYRPDWIEAWSEGRDAGDLALPPEQRWQPKLWRALLDSASPEQRGLHRAALHRRFIERLATLDALPPGLPPRLFVFGISALPHSIVEALHALSAHIDVALLVTNPCRYYWGDVVSEREALRRDERARRRHPERPGLAELDPARMHLSANPLLAGWGAQGRDFIQALYAFEESHGFSAEADVFRDRAMGGDASLLEQLQQEVLELVHPFERAEQEGGRRMIDAEDDSVRLVAAHSPLREIEILFDQLLDGFERDPTLAPRDIVVLVPEIDRYAPFIEAVFGRLGVDDPRRIPFSIADRRASRASPLLGCATALLELPHRRLAVNELLDWLDIPAFRRRFGILDGQLELIARWLEQSGVRWGLSSAHRQRLGLPALDANSWRFGLSRMLLGYAMGDTPPGQETGLAEIDPFDEVQGLDAALVGRLATLVEALEEAAGTLAEPTDREGWVARIEALMLRFFEPREEYEHDTLGRLSSALDGWGEACRLADYRDEIPLEVVREALVARLDEGGLAPRFLAGRVNFATLMPMRAIPFRHVYLLGMNDGDYPRPQLTQDFDLMAARPRGGDRSRRDDDRYLMLEALLATRERLTLSWVGFDQRSNQPRPPSVLVSELLDVITQGWQVDDEGDDDARARAAIERWLIQYHPLQPFSPCYFSARAEARSQLFSYDDHWLKLHQPVAERAAPPALAAAPERIGLDALARLWRDPPSVCLGERLGVRFGEPEALAEDAEPFALDGRDRYQLKRELLGAALEGRSLDQAALRLERAGRLPALGFGAALLDDILPALERQLERWSEETAVLRRAAAQSLQLEHGGLLLESRLDGLHQGPLGLCCWRLEPTAFGELKRDPQGRLKRLGKPHRLIELHLFQLAASVAYAEPVSAHALFEDQCLHLPALAPSSSEARLRTLLECWSEAWRAPFAAPRELSLDYLIDLNEDPEIARDNARARYEQGDWRRPALRRARPAMAELWPDFAALERAGFARFSELLYRPLLEMLESIDT